MFASDQTKKGQTQLQHLRLTFPILYCQREVKGSDSAKMNRNATLSGSLREGYLIVIVCCGFQ